MVQETIRILGLDPGLQRTGWGVIAVTGNKLGFVAAGTIRSAAGDDLARRLMALYDGIADIVAAYEPDEAAVEETFVNANPTATLKLGQARAMALLAPAKAGLPVAEYAPNLVKKSVVGAGHAEKAQVAHMVKLLLPKATTDGADAVDALAIAICHAHHRGAMRLKERVMREAGR
jgi:crossover junction endodeoxyribonuclease RuvC